MCVFIFRFLITMAPITLIYFDVRARAELIRMALVYGGLEFEDKRIPFYADEWYEMKPSKYKKTKRQTPYMRLGLLHPLRQRTLPIHSGTILISKLKFVFIPVYPTLACVNT